MCGQLLNIVFLQRGSKASTAGNRYVQTKPLWTSRGNRRYNYEIRTDFPCALAGSVVSRFVAVDRVPTEISVRRRRGQETSVCSERNGFDVKTAGETARSADAFYRGESSAG